MVFLIAFNNKDALLISIDKSIEKLTSLYAGTSLSFKY